VSRGAPLPGRSRPLPAARASSARLGTVRVPALAGAALALVALGAFGTIGAFGFPGAMGSTLVQALEATAPDVKVTFHGLAVAFPDGAPARVAGGFGGDTCLACHWEFDDEVDSEGSLRVTGLPEAWTPGTSYTLEIEVERPGMVVGGFQLVARFAADTAQAGTFRIPERESGRIAVLEEGGLLFAQHTEEGTPAIEGTESVRWRVVWEAPGVEAPGGGEVVLNVSVVAGDGDRSQMGDYVYSSEFRVSR
jgi:hypothetical protein